MAARDRISRKTKLKKFLCLVTYNNELELEDFIYLTSMPRKHRFWARQIYLDRQQKGEYHLLVQQAKHFDAEIFFQMFRMSATQFEELLQLISPYIVKNSLRREAIKPEERLAVTMRFLATGDAFKTIGASYRISTPCVSRIVKETCNVLWTVLQGNGFIKAPETPNEWKTISEQFEKKWNFPNCLGAIDGKHVIIQCPPRGGSMFFNYKKFHSIVLMAVVNANYEFILVDIGDYGRLSDGSVFSSSHLGMAINDGALNLPSPRRLDQVSNKLYPYVFVGDDAFPMKPCLLKPYPGQQLSIEERVFNYRLSRARRIVENAFGIATARFRVFRRPICAHVDTANAVTKAIVVLHNYLMKGIEYRGNFQYYQKELVDRETDDGGVISGTWRTGAYNHALTDISNLGSNNYSVLAKEVRSNFKTYFNSCTGSLPWQLDYVQSTEDYFDRS